MRNLQADRYPITQPHGIMFHHFHGARHRPGQGSLSAEQLDDLLDFLDTSRILPAREWLKRAVDGSLVRSDICLTFDDNLRCQYDVALPVLKTRGLDAFWFVYTSVNDGTIEKLEVYREFRNSQFASIDEFYSDFFATLEQSLYSSEVAHSLANFQPDSYLRDFVFYSDNDRKFRFLRDQVLGPERYCAIMDSMLAARKFDVVELAKNLWLTNTQIKELHKLGHVVGLHSQTHPTALCSMSASEQLREYQTNFSRITEILGEKPAAMAHPCNSYDQTTLQILHGLGIQVGFRSNMTGVKNRGPLEFPREDHTNVRLQSMSSSFL